MRTERSSIVSRSETPHPRRGALDRRSRHRHERLGVGRSTPADLPNSALHDPKAGFGDIEFHSDLADEAAVPVVRIAENHPLPDGNQRPAWQSLTIPWLLNGYRFEVATDDGRRPHGRHRCRRHRRNRVADRLAERIQALDSA